MFNAHIYAARREALCRRLKSGLILLVGHVDSPVNFDSNPYPFRQDSSFSYFFGLNRPGLAAIIDANDSSATIFGDEPGPEHDIWFGKTQPVGHLASQAGVSTVKSYDSLAGMIRNAIDAKRNVHYLPPYRGETRIELSRILQRTVPQIDAEPSTELIKAVVALREIKGAEEVAQIEEALAVAAEMHLVAMRAARPGVFEREVVAEMQSVLWRHGLQQAYPSIFTRRGEILHSLDYGARLERGDIVVNDSGASSAEGYASDVTRTLPVGGRFDARQRDLYRVLLDAQESAIAAIRPRVPYRNVHRLSTMKIVDGMKDLGFFRGPAEDIFDSGAYAICFTHGIGHQLGLDVHDMESLGEDHVGYDTDVRRSDLFGLRNLRLGKPLCAGMVVTVEPGIYFTPALIERWEAEGRYASVINYKKFREHLNFGGMRIEDEVLVSEASAHVMGPPIPKTLTDVEEAMGR